MGGPKNGDAGFWRRWPKVFGYLSCNPFLIEVILWKWSHFVKFERDFLLPRICFSSLLLCFSPPNFPTTFSYPPSSFYSLPLVGSSSWGWLALSRWAPLCSIFLTRWYPLHALEMTSLELAPDAATCLIGRFAQGIIFHSRYWPKTLPMFDLWSRSVILDNDLVWYWGGLDRS